MRVPRHARAIREQHRCGARFDKAPGLSETMLNNDETLRTRVGGRGHLVRQLQGLNLTCKEGEGDYDFAASSAGRVSSS